MTDDTKKSVSSKNRNVFTLLIELTYKYGKNTLLYATMAFLVYVFAIREIINPPQRHIREQLEQIEKEKEELHLRGIEKRNNADILIPALLEQLRLNIHATRILLFEFHNSTSNINNLPFYHFSATYESIDYNDNTLSSIIDSYNFQRIGDYSDFLVKLKEKKYIYVPSLKNANPQTRMYVKLMRSGAKSAYFFEIDGTVLPSGVLVIISNNEELDEVLINKTLPKVIVNISTMLDGIYRPSAGGK